MHKFDFQVCAQISSPSHRIHKFPVQMYRKHRKDGGSQARDKKQSDEIYWDIGNPTESFLTFLVYV